MSSRSYTLKQLPLLGAEVRRIDLKQQVPESVIATIKQDVAEHAILVFKDQGSVSADRHVEISQWFGELVSVFYQHPKSPHYDIFRVSNDENEGCRGVGRTGWHIDGTFMPRPYSHSLYHMVSVPKNGDTAFTSLYKLVEDLSTDKKQKWSRLWMTGDRKNQTVIHPLIYTHPGTRKETLCFHLGMTNAFIWDKDSPEQRTTPWQETCQILDEIHNEVVRNDHKFIYSHKWQEGDFIISDNLAVGHEATPNTQRPVSEVGLRIMHRTTVGGQFVPTKNRGLDNQNDLKL